MEEEDINVHMEEDAQRQGLQESDALSFCPSFGSYTSGSLAEIAARVANESSNGLDSDDDGGFEFAFTRSGSDVTADEIFRDGRIRQVFPIFNRDIRGISGNHGQNDDDDGDNKRDVSTLTLPLKKLFVEDGGEREPLLSSSTTSSEADELESIPEGTYCVWRPELAGKPPGRCRKSNSTGSASNRWKPLRDLLHRRSNSEGKDSFVFLTPKNRERKSEKQGRVEDKKENGEQQKAGKMKVATAASSAHEVFYVRNRAAKEGDKRKSYLPYRQDIFGFFASVNGSGYGKSFPPFLK